MKKLLSVILVLGVILSLISGCGSTDEEPEETVEATEAKTESVEMQGEEKTASMKVGISVMFSHSFFDTITEGVKSVMEPLGYTVIEKSGEFDVQAQIIDVEDFIAQECDAIFIEPFDSAGIKPALEAAQKAGIPVICLDAPADDLDLIVANVATDNYDAGVQSALQLIQDLGGEGKIIVLDSPQANSSLRRAEGFLDTLSEEAPDIEILAQHDYAGEKDTAFQIMSNVVQLESEVDAVYACNENGILGTISAIEEVGREGENIRYYTVDGSSEFVKMVGDGEVAGVACQQPYLIGVFGAEAMINALNEQMVPKEVKVPVVYITKDTVGDFEGF